MVLIVPLRFVATGSCGLRATHHRTSGVVANGASVPLACSSLTKLSFHPGAG